MAVADKNRTWHETASVYYVAAQPVIGVLHRGHPKCKTGIVFVVGGRQYRTGAHRQFVRLARSLSGEGFAVFRFDLRGMGDSAAVPLHFLDTGPDIAAAIRDFKRQVPWLDRIILWGLCDGASASIRYASRSDVAGVMMVNPWITTDVGSARTTLKHYYRNKIVSASFWRKFCQNEISVSKSFRALIADIWLVLRRRDDARNVGSNLPDVVFEAMDKFKGELAVVLSDRDLTAQEFKDEHERRDTSSWDRKPDVCFFHVCADHTFSVPEQHRQLETLTLDWCRKLESQVHNSE